VARPGYRVGVDVGGTFTDLVLVRDGAAGVSPTLEGFECLGARPHRVSNAIGALLEGQALQYVVDAIGTDVRCHRAAAFVTRRC